MERRRSGEHDVCVSAHNLPNIGLDGEAVAGEVHMAESKRIRDDQGGRRTATPAFVGFVILITLVMIFPIYGLGNRVEPFVLGMPFSMIWVIFWIVVEFFGVIAFFLYEHGRERE